MVDVPGWGELFAIFSKNVPQAAFKGQTDKLTDIAFLK